MRKLLSKNTTLLLTFIMMISSGCGESGPTLELVRSHFYDYERLSEKLEELQAKNERIITLGSIGSTYENRSIYSVKLSGNQSTSTKEKPALLAIYTEHAGEHDMTNLAIGTIEYLSNNYGKNERVTALLNSVDIWIIPMMNPDGVAYAFSGAVEPFTWRKNRRPLGGGIFGVDLNRNWIDLDQVVLQEPLTQEDFAPLREKSSDNYAGSAPFSESETKAVRDFLLGRPNIEIFVDYHSGGGGFMQGFTGCFAGDPKTKKRCAETIGQFAQKISDENDNAPHYVLMESDEDIIDELKKHAPIFIKPFLPDRLTPTVGKSLDYVQTLPGVMAIGIETQRNGKFFKELPESTERQVAVHVRGFMFLLETLADEQ